MLINIPETIGQIFLNFSISLLDVMVAILLIKDFSMGAIFSHDPGYA